MSNFLRGLNESVERNLTATCGVAESRIELNEATLSRVLSHFGTEGFAVVTAWRDVSPARGFDSKGGVDPGQPVSKDQNRENLQDLKNQIRKAGYGFIPITGVFPGGSEPSLFVPAKRKDDQVDPQKLRTSAIFWGQRYRQWGVIWGDGGRAEGIDTWDTENDRKITPKVSMRWAKFTPKAVGDYYSRFQKKDFTLESQTKFYLHRAPGSLYEGMSRSQSGEWNIAKIF